MLRYFVQRCEWKGWKILSNDPQIVSYGSRGVESHVYVLGGGSGVVSGVEGQRSPGTVNFVLFAKRLRRTSLPRSYVCQRTMKRTRTVRDEHSRSKLQVRKPYVTPD